MNVNSLFDGVTTFVAAAGAAAAIYTFAAKNTRDVVPVVLTLSGATYEVLLGASGLLVVFFELRYWNGPVVRRSSYSYRLMLTPQRNGIPTRWEIASRSRRRDQTLTVLFGLFACGLLGVLMYSALSDDLRKGFPVRSWSLTWFSGSVALAAVLFVSFQLMWRLKRQDRLPRRKKRCVWCGELSAHQARRCSNCREPFPDWLLRQTLPRGPK